MGDEQDYVSFHSFLFNNPSPDAQGGVRIKKAFAYIIFFYIISFFYILCFSCWLIKAANAEGSNILLWEINNIRRQK